MTALVLAAALLAAPEPGSPGSLGILGERVVERLKADFATPDRRIEKVEGNRVVLAPGGLRRGSELEVFTEAMPLRDPTSFEVMGALLKPIARARVVAENDKLCLAVLTPLAGEPGAQVGDIARLAASTVDLGLRPGPVEAELEPLLRALLQTLPYRLKQTGLFNTRLLSGGSAPDLPALRAETAAQGLDGMVSLGLFRDQGRLALLVEVVASESDGLSDLYTTVAPWDLEAELVTRAAGLAGLGSAQPGVPAFVRELPGEVLAIATAPTADEQPASIIALTDEALWTELDA